MKIANSRSKAKELLITISDFKGGTNSLIDEARMPTQFAVESNNMMQVQDGLWKTRWGSQYFGVDHGATIDGASEYVKSDGTTELITIAGGYAYRSKDGGSLTQISGATFTAGKQCYFLQMGGYDSSGVAQSYLYIANGVDTLARYNGSVLTTYTQISAPTSLTSSFTASGLSSGTNVLYAQVTALNDIGETNGSTEASVTVSAIRDNWRAGIDKVVWSWAAVSGANHYQIYLSDQSGYETLLGDSSTTSFTDDGTNAINPYVEVPAANSTGAPKFISMCTSNNRIWCTNDKNNMYTVYFSGTGRNIGNFSDFYGGGWINLERGGREIPVAVKHYQRGSGEGCPTVLCRTPDGRGAIWQIGIDSLTVGSESFSVPSAVKVGALFGSEAVNSVINALNEIAFANRKGWYTLGPQRQYYGILRTNETSSNIRPYWRSLVGANINNVCAYYYDAKEFISVATSTAGNDRTIIFDTEKGNWAVDWNIGAKQFLEYADSSNNTHFLAVPTNGTKLIEISVNYLNDSGTAFNQSYISPLIPVSKNNTDIFTLRYAIARLGRPKGVVKFQLLGIGKAGSFSTLASKTLSNFGAGTGIGSDAFGAVYASSTKSSVKKVGGVWTIYLTAAPSAFTQAVTPVAIKKRVKIYAIQFKLFSTSADTDFTILSLQAKGMLTPRKLPSAWT